MQLYYPAQGSKRFATSAFPMVKSFRVDFGDSSAFAGDETLSFPERNLRSWLVRSGQGSFYLNR